MQIIDRQGVRFLQVNYPLGKVSIEDIRTARQEARPSLQHAGIGRLLVDFRQVDMSGITIIEIDDLSQELKQRLPECRKAALLYCSGSTAHLVPHIANVCSINGIDTEAFSDPDIAVSWLCLEG